MLPHYMSYNYHLNMKGGFCMFCNMYFDSEIELQNHLKVEHNHENESSSNSVCSYRDKSKSGDLESVSLAKIQKFRRLVYNAEIGKGILTRRILWDVLMDRKKQWNSNSNESDDEIDDSSDDESLYGFDKTLDTQLSDIHLQLLRTMLTAAENKMFKLTTSYFMDIIEDFKFKEIK
jgi:hypothetical protein